MASINVPQKLEERRRALGMSKRAVAARAQVSLPTVNRILSGREKRLTVGNVEAIAKALGIVIRLGAAPGVDEVASAFDFREKQAMRKAKRLVRMVQGTMGLEAQAVSADVLQQMIKQTVCELLAGSARRLWSD